MISRSFTTDLYWKDRYTASFDEQHLISALDIYPTLLEIGGVAPDEPTEGVSLVPLLSGSVLRLTRRHDHLLDNRRTGDPMGGRAEGYALRTKRWHFYWYRDTGDMRLYDVTPTPEERVTCLKRDPIWLQNSKHRSWRGVSKKGLLATSQSTSKGTP